MTSRLDGAPLAGSGEMLAAIAERYDPSNSVLSLGVDQAGYVSIPALPILVSPAGGAGVSPGARQVPGSSNRANAPRNSAARRVLTSAHREPGLARGDCAMSISKGAVAAAVVWSASIAFAGVVFILLRAPVVPPRSYAVPLIASEVAVVVEPPATVLEVAPTLIVGERSARATPTGTPSARQVRCGEWRALAQGDVSQRVRACE